jgi:CubicO group peptidase (beta-lactamase class C family)
MDNPRLQETICPGAIVPACFCAAATIAPEAPVAAALPAAAETPSEKADALLDGLIKTNDPGLAVLVAQGGNILFEKGYGLADLAHHVPATPHTTFRIGSITKQFTAAAILWHLLSPK